MQQTGLTQHREHFPLPLETYPEIRENSDCESPTAKGQVIVIFKSNLFGVGYCLQLHITVRQGQEGLSRTENRITALRGTENSLSLDLFIHIFQHTAYLLSSQGMVTAEMC